MRLLQSVTGSSSDSRSSQLSFSRSISVPRVPRDRCVHSLRSLRTVASAKGLLNKALEAVSASRELRMGAIKSYIRQLAAQGLAAPTSTTTLSGVVFFVRLHERPPAGSKSSSSAGARLTRGTRRSAGAQGVPSRGFTQSRFVVPSQLVVRHATSHPSRDSRLEDADAVEMSLAISRALKAVPNGLMCPLEPEDVDLCSSLEACEALRIDYIPDDAVIESLSIADAANAVREEVESRSIKSATHSPTRISRSSPLARTFLDMFACPLVGAASFGRGAGDGKPVPPLTLQAGDFVTHAGVFPMSDSRARSSFEEVGDVGRVLRVWRPAQQLQYAEHDPELSSAERQAAILRKADAVLSRWEQQVRSSVGERLSESDVRDTASRPMRGYGAFPWFSRSSASLLMLRELGAIGFHSNQGGGYGVRCARPSRHSLAEARHVAKASALSVVRTAVFALGEDIQSASVEKTAQAFASKLPFPSHPGSRGDVFPGVRPWSLGGTRRRPLGRGAPQPLPMLKPVQTRHTPIIDNVSFQAQYTLEPTDEGKTKFRLRLERSGLDAVSRSSGPASVTNGLLVERLKVNAVVDAHDFMAVYNCAWDQSGRVLFTGGDDGTIKMWSARPLLLQATLRDGFPSVVQEISVSPDNTLIASSYEPSSAASELAEEHKQQLVRPVRVWRMQTLEPAAVLAAHTGEIRCTAWDPCFTSCLITASRDGSVRVWDLTGKFFRREQDEPDSDSSASFREEGVPVSVTNPYYDKTLALGTEEDAASALEQARAEAEARRVERDRRRNNAIREGRALPDAAAEALVEDTLTNSFVPPIQPGIACLTIRPKKLSVAARRKSKGGSRPSSLEITSAAVYPFGGVVAIGCSDGTVRIHRTIAVVDKGGDVRGDFSKCQTVRHVMESSAPSSVQRDDSLSRCTPRFADARSTDVVFHPLQARSLPGWRDGWRRARSSVARASGWRSPTPKASPKKGRSRPSVHADAESEAPDRECFRAISSALDRELSTGEQFCLDGSLICVFGEPESGADSDQDVEFSVDSISFSPSGDALVIIGEDGRARVWRWLAGFQKPWAMELDPWTGERDEDRKQAVELQARARFSSNDPLRVYNGGLGIEDVQWTAGGRFLVTTQVRSLTNSERDQEAAHNAAGNPPMLLPAIKVWHPKSGALVRTLPTAHADAVTSLTPHPTDPRIVASGDALGVVCVWDVESGHLLRSFSVQNTDKEAYPTSSTARERMAEQAMEQEELTGIPARVIERAANSLSDREDDTARSQLVQASVFVEHPWRPTAHNDVLGPSLRAGARHADGTDGTAVEVGMSTALAVVGKVPPQESPPASAVGRSASDVLEIMEDFSSGGVQSGAVTGTEVPWRHGDMERSLIELPKIFEIRWNVDREHTSSNGSGMAVTDESGRVYLIETGPAESLWHTPLSAGAAPSIRQFPAVARVGATQANGMSDVPYSQYLLGDYDPVSRELNYAVTDSTCRVAPWQLQFDPRTCLTNHNGASYIHLAQHRRLHPAVLPPPVAPRDAARRTVSMIVARSLVEAVVTPSDEALARLVREEASSRDLMGALRERSTALMAVLDSMPLDPLARSLEVRPLLGAKILREHGLLGSASVPTVASEVVAMKRPGRPPAKRKAPSDRVALRNSDWESGFASADAIAAAGIDETEDWDLDYDDVDQYNDVVEEEEEDDEEVVEEEEPSRALPARRARAFLRDWSDSDVSDAQPRPSPEHRPRAAARRRRARFHDGDDDDSDSEKGSPRRRGRRGRQQQRVLASSSDEDEPERARVQPPVRPVRRSLSPRPEDPFTLLEWKISRLRSKEDPALVSPAIPFPPKHLGQLVQRESARTVHLRSLAAVHNHDFGWLANILPTPLAYAPQLGDDVVYVPDGHKQWLQRHPAPALPTPFGNTASDAAGPERPPLPWWRSSVTAVRCVIVAVTFGSPCEIRPMQASLPEDVQAAQVISSKGRLFPGAPNCIKAFVTLLPVAVTQATSSVLSDMVSAGVWDEDTIDHSRPSMFTVEVFPSHLEQQEFLVLTHRFESSLKGLEALRTSSSSRHNLPLLMDPYLESDAYGPVETWVDGTTKRDPLERSSVAQRRYKGWAYVAEEELAPTSPPPEPAASPTTIHRRRGRQAAASDTTTTVVSSAVASALNRRREAAAVVLSLRDRRSRRDATQQARQERLQARRDAAARRNSTSLLSLSANPTRPAATPNNSRTLAHVVDVNPVAEANVRHDAAVNEAAVANARATGEVVPKIDPIWLWQPLEEAPAAKELKREMRERHKTSPLPSWVNDALSLDQVLALVGQQRLCQFPLPKVAVVEWFQYRLSRTAESAIWECVKGSASGSDQVTRFSPWEALWLDFEALENEDESAKLRHSLEQALETGQCPHIPTLVRKLLVRVFQLVRRAMVSTAWQLFHPVDGHSYPLYPEWVRVPLSITEVLRRIAHGYYRQCDALLLDVLHVHWNCIMFNERHSELALTSAALVSTLVCVVHFAMALSGHATLPTGAPPMVLAVFGAEERLGAVGGRICKELLECAPGEEASVVVGLQEAAIRAVVAYSQDVFPDEIEGAPRQRSRSSELDRRAAVDGLVLLRQRAPIVLSTLDKGVPLPKRARDEEEGEEEPTAKRVKISEDHHDSPASPVVVDDDDDFAPKRPRRAASPTSPEAQDSSSSSSPAAEDSSSSSSDDSSSSEEDEEESPMPRPSRRGRRPRPGIESSDSESSDHSPPRPSKRTRASNSLDEAVPDDDEEVAHPSGLKLRLSRAGMPVGAYFVVSGGEPSSESEASPPRPRTRAAGGTPPSVGALPSAARIRLSVTPKPRVPRTRGGRRASDSDE
jgi:WD40 repeat protein